MYQFNRIVVFGDCRIATSNGLGAEQHQAWVRSRCASGGLACHEGREDLTCALRTPGCASPPVSTRTARGLTGGAAAPDAAHTWYRNHVWGAIDIRDRKP